MLKLASELESDLQETMDWDRMWLVDFNAGKSQLVWFDQCKNTGTIGVKTDGSVLEGKSSFKMLGWLSHLHWIGPLALSLLLKLPPRKLKPWSVVWSSFNWGCSVPFFSIL